MADTKRYPVPATEARVEQVVSRSRFIATLARADTTESAKGFVARVSAEFVDATHNCWAYLVGEPGSSGQVGMSDDGEPHGTAGRPMLNILTHSGVGDVAVVVTRYFGGTKLGTGGLVRAYSGAVQAALDCAGTVEKIEWTRLQVEIVYPLLEQLKLLYPRFEAEVEDEQFTDSVTLLLRLPLEQLDGFKAAVLDLSNGKARLEPRS